MKVSKSDLIKLLNEQMGSEEDAVASQFDKLLADIKKTASKGDSFIIHGFGTFTQNQEQLTFDIAPSFAAEINYRYEGMLPIDVDRSGVSVSETKLEKPSKRTLKKAVVIVDEDVAGEEDPFRSTNETVSEHQLIDPKVDLNDTESHRQEQTWTAGQSSHEETAAEYIPESDKKSKWLIDESVDVNEKLQLESGIHLTEAIDGNEDQTIGNIKEEVPGIPDEFEERVESEPDLTPNSDSLEHDSNDDDPLLLVENKESKQDERAPLHVNPEEDKKVNGGSGFRLYKWVSVAFVFVLIGGGSYWYLTGPGNSLFKSLQTVFTQSKSPQSVENPIFTPADEPLPIDLNNQTKMSSDSLEDELVADISQVTSTTEFASAMDSVDNHLDVRSGALSESDVSEKSFPSNRDVPNETGANYGLYGEVKLLNGKVFSIIIHSLPSQISAQEQCNEIRVLDIRCFVSEATSPQGRTTYRVGIGQFESIESASQAVVELPEPYKSRNFIAGVN